MFIDAGAQFGNPPFWPTRAEISNNNHNPLDALSSFLFGLESQSFQKDKSQIDGFFSGGVGWVAINGPFFTCFFVERLK